MRILESIIFIQVASDLYRPGGPAGIACFEDPGLLPAEANDVGERSIRPRAEHQKDRLPSCDQPAKVRLGHRPPQRLESLGDLQRILTGTLLGPDTL